MSTLVVAIDARLAGGQSTGDSTYWNGLLLGLSELNEDFRLLVYINGPKPTGIPDDPRFTLVSAHARSERMWSLIRFPISARKMGAQVVHTQYNLSPLACKRGVTTIHDVSFFIGPEWFPARHRLLLQQFVPSSARRARAVLTVSETSKKEIERYIPASRGKVHVTPNALNPAIRPQDRTRAEAVVVERFGVKPPFLLSVGTRWPRKNMQLAVDAARMAGLPLVLTGKAGWGEERYGEHVVATGYVSDVELSALYSSAAAYLAPSRHEGFGLPLLEAFACGCPVVCSSGGALPEVAADAALVMPSWEPGDWAARIRELLADSSKVDAMRVRGLRRLSDFSWAETARQTLRVYREAAI